jgi:hypothetical protein
MSETAVENPDESISKGAKRLMMGVAAGAMGRLAGTGAC